MTKKKIVFLVGYNYLKTLKKFKNNPYHFIIPSKDKAFPLSLQKDFIKCFKSRVHPTDYSIKNLKKILLNIKPDFLICLGWRRILPQEIIYLVNQSINVHPAILPDYKGYHPIPYVLMNNEKKHGITAHFITTKVDSGKIILCKKFAISEFSTINSIQEKIKKMMPHFLNELIKILNHKKILTKVNNNKKTKIIAPKRTSKDSEIKPGMYFKDAFNLIRSCDPSRFPAYYLVNAQKVYVSLSRNMSKNKKKHHEDI